MRLSNLINDLIDSGNKVIVNGDTDIEFTDLSDNSGDAKEGDLFVSLSSDKEKSAQHILHAISNGVKIILTCYEMDLSQYEVVVIKVENVRYIFCVICAIYFHNLPSNIVAVTGTNGKTSVVNFVMQLYGVLGKKSAAIGTIGVTSNNIENNILDSLNKRYNIGLTSLNILALYRLLTQLKLIGVDHVAIEASSHGIDQYRVSAGLNLKAAGFLNITHEHLDYHKTLESYLATKAKLFSEILPVGHVAILNKDIKEYDFLQQICKARNQKIITYGSCDGCDIRLFESYYDYNNANIVQKFTFSIFGYKFSCFSEIIGKFQIYNILCAIAFCLSDDEFVVQYDTIKKIIDKIATIKSVSGRMEKVKNIKSDNIYIDYAHTPDSLKNALLNLKEFADKIQGKLVVVFGCGGNRDKDKRPKMGEIASSVADLVIVTDDNPRNEDPIIIRQEIVSGCIKNNFLEIGDRQQAIYYAIEQLGKNDILLIAGKGHENTQIIGEKINIFSDKEQVESYYL